MTKSEAYRLVLEDLVAVAEGTDDHLSDLLTLRETVSFHVDTFLHETAPYALENGDLIIHSELTDSDGWTPVTVEKPKEGQRIIGWDGRNQRLGMAWIYGSRVYVKPIPRWSVPMTYWREAPADPVEGE